MLALSTSWRSTTLTNGEALVAALAQHAVDGVELEYRISAKAFSPMPAALKRVGLPVVSVHNFFPHPADMARFRPSGDLFSLSHDDKEIRRRAVAMTARTIEIANDLEAGVVVLHCGWVAMEPEIAVLQSFFHSGEMSSESAQKFVARKLAERDRLKAPHIEALLFSLDALVGLANRQGVMLGLENRAHYHELPGPEDFALFFKEFDGGPLGYWHDSGHAHINEVLGTCAPGSLLTTYGKHLIGLHLHDALGLADHLPAGTGEIDFKPLKPYLTPRLPRVIELAPGTPDADVAATIRYFREHGLA